METNNCNKESKIFIVDDDKTIRTFLETFLKKKGFEYVQTFGNGQDALNAIEKEEVRLVLLDVKLPDIDGVDVLRRIKKINKDIAVIMITGFPDEEKAKEAISAGAYDYIIKPFDLFYLELILLTKIIQLSYSKDKK
jgi:DNA-binding NtrC family response regulator